MNTCSNSALSDSFDIPERFVDPICVLGCWVTDICATRLKYTRYALTETLALEKAVKTATKHVNLDETLMVVTADHSHAYGVIGYANRRRQVLNLDNSRLALDGYPYHISAYFSGPGGSAKQPRGDPSNDRIF
ncbi:hypothetical protein P879_11978, partial [Paragonimus westermani]